MSALNIRFDHPDYSDEALIESITGILDSGFILAMSTVQNGDAYINSAHFAYNDRLELVIFTHPQSEHSQNLLTNLSIAVAVWKQPESWGQNLQGLQLFGIGVPLNGEALEEAVQTYTARFPGFSHIIQSAADFEAGKTPMRMYALHIERLKLIDEPRFGKRTWISTPVYAVEPQLLSNW